MVCQIEKCIESCYHKTLLFKSCILYLLKLLPMYYKQFKGWMIVTKTGTLELIITCPCVCKSVNETYFC